MFTGIIEEKGELCDVKIAGISGSIKIKAKKVLEKTKLGDSIAVNGVCLTVTQMGNDFFCADVMAETLRRSSLGKLSKGDKVNLERAMPSDGRFGGHIVSGHIDGTGTICKIKVEGNATWIYINASKEILNLIVEKGSIAIDGISLTVASVSEKDFAVSIIPHTASETTLLDKKVGDCVNLENDVIGKYVQKLILGNVQNSTKESTQEERDKKILEFLNS